MLAFYHATRIVIISSFFQSVLHWSVAVFTICRHSSRVVPFSRQSRGRSSKSPGLPFSPSGSQYPHHSKVYPPRKQSQLLFSIASSNGIQLNALIFGAAIYYMRSCTSGCDYVFHFTCVMPIPGKTFQTCYILATNKTVKQ